MVSPLAASSRWRRRTRSAGVASRKIFTSACGNTTVPMSRPSITTLVCSPISRCLATMARRTPGMAEIFEAPFDISGVRIASVTSSPLSAIRPGDSSMRAAIANCSARCMSFGSTPWREAHSATARYMAPVSM